MPTQEGKTDTIDTSKLGGTSRTDYGDGQRAKVGIMVNQLDAVNAQLQGEIRAVRSSPDAEKVQIFSVYEKIGIDIGRLVADKNAAYGQSFAKSGDVIRLMYPDGITPAQYDDLLSVVRIIDKLFRIAADADAFGESPYRDIAGYGILGTARGSRIGPKPEPQYGRDPNAKSPGFTFLRFAEKHGMALLPWQIEAAGALLSVVHKHRHAATGKTFLMDLLNAFIIEHGNEFELD